MNNHCFFVYWQGDRGQRQQLKGIYSSYNEALDASQGYGWYGCMGIIDCVELDKNFKINLEAKKC